LIIEEEKKFMAHKLERFSNYKNYLYLLSDFIVRGVTLLSLPLFLKFMSVEEYGLFSLYQSIAGFTIIFLSFNLSSSIIKIQLNRNYNLQSIKNAINLSLVFTIVLFVLSFSIYFMGYIHSNTLFTIILILLYSLFTSIIFIELENLRSKEKVGKYCIISVSYAFVTTIMGFISILYFPGDSAVLRFISLATITAIVGVTILIRYNSKISGPFIERNLLKDMLFTAIPLLPFTLASTMLIHINKIVLGFISIEHIGYYTFAANIALLIYIISLSLNKAIQVKMMQSLKENKLPNKELLVNFTLFYISYLIMIIFTKQLIVIFGNQNYLSVEITVKILVLGYGFAYFFAILSNILYYFGDSMVLGKISLIGAIVLFILDITLIPKYGLNGAAFAVLLTYLYMFLHSYKYIFEHYKYIKFQFRIVIIYLIAIVLPFFVT